MKLSMTGGWTPYTTLSPENLAANVWGALATSFNEAGTMGNKLNTASSGGVDLDAMAATVWAYTTRSMPAAERDAFAQALLTAAQSTPIHANVKEVNDTTVDGSGTALDPWGPV